MEVLFSPRSRKEERVIGESHYAIESWGDLEGRCLGESAKIGLQKEAIGVET